MQFGPLFSAAVLTVAVVYGFLLTLASAAGIFGLPLMLLILLSLWRYGYEVLREVTQGREPPPPDPDTANPWGDLTSVLHGLLFFAFGAAFALTPIFGDGAEGAFLRILCLVLLLIVFPASAGILGVTRNFGAAMNPFAIITVIRVMRADYLGVLIVCGAIVVVTSGVLSVLGDAGFIAGMIGAIVATWAQLALFASVGAGIRAHADDFDLPGDPERREASDELAHERARAQALDRAYASIRSGLVAQGYRTIHELARDEGEGPEIYHWLFNRMLLWEDRTHAAAIVPRFLEILIARGRQHAAIELVAQIRRTPGVSHFQLPPGIAAELAAYARSIGRERVAEELIASAAPPAAAQPSVALAASAAAAPALAPTAAAPAASASTASASAPER